jgi:hypothetical protein
MEFIARERKKEMLPPFHSKGIYAGVTAMNEMSEKRLRRFHFVAANKATNLSYDNGKEVDQ